MYWLVEINNETVPFLKFIMYETSQSYETGGLDFSASLARMIFPPKQFSPRNYCISPRIPSPLHALDFAKTRVHGVVRSSCLSA